MLGLAEELQIPISGNGDAPHDPAHWPSLAMVHYENVKKNARVVVFVVVLLYGLVCTRLQHSKNIKSCIGSR